MPRKTKETNEITNPVIPTKKATAKKSVSTKTDVKKSTNKKNIAKNDDKKDVTVHESKVVKSTSIKKDSDTKKKTSNTKKKTSKKTSTTKVTTKTATKKSTLQKTNSSKEKKQKIDIVEYYDLPYRYNQTIVKVLAQTPTNLFIYWDISDDDREKYKIQYGEDFFETTKPVLIIHNITMNYSFEVDINDFANSWYLHVNDAKCDYKVELGRRPIKQSQKINTDYIYISTSNDIQAPNNHILFNREQKMVYFKNVKTGTHIEKPISANISFIRNMGKIYNIYDIYKAIYENEYIEEIYDLSNPSSGNPSSGSLSSKFK